MDEKLTYEKPELFDIHAVHVYAQGASQPAVQPSPDCDLLTSEL